MAWSTLTNEDRTKTLRRAAKFGLQEGDLSSQDDLIVGRGGLRLDPRSGGHARAARVKVKDLDQLVDLYGHPEATRSTQLAAVKQNERRIVLRELQELRDAIPTALNTDGRTYNSMIAAYARGAVQATDLSVADRKILDEIAGRVVGTAWFFPDVVIEANNPLIFSGSGPHSLVANKLTIQPGGRIVGESATISISCNILEVQ